MWRAIYGIVRRAEERNAKINPRLKEVLLSISSEMDQEEIEKRSRVQKRGAFSQKVSKNKEISNQTNLFNFDKNNAISYESNL